MSTYPTSYTPQCTIIWYKDTNTIFKIEYNLANQMNVRKWVGHQKLNILHWAMLLISK